MDATPYTVKVPLLIISKHGSLLEVRTIFGRTPMNIPCSLLYEVRGKNTSPPQTVVLAMQIIFTLTGFGGESGYVWSELFSAEPGRRSKQIHIHGSTSLFKSWRPPRHNSRRWVNGQWKYGKPASVRSAKDSDERLSKALKFI